MVSLAPKGQGPAIQKEVSLSSGQTAPTATRMLGQEAVPSPPRNSVSGKSSTYLTSCVHLILRWFHFCKHLFISFERRTQTSLPITGSCLQRVSKLFKHIGTVTDTNFVKLNPGT